MTDKEKEAMQKGVLKTFLKLCHRIVEVTKFDVIEHEDNTYDCVLEGYVGSIRKKKRYSFKVVPHKSKTNCKIMKDIDIVEI